MRACRARNWTGAPRWQTFHLVLLDNGRTATLGDEIGRDALHCISARPA
jgi:L-lactate dehydrogenase complex protein LldF